MTAQVVTNTTDAKAQLLMSVTPSEAASDHAPIQAAFGR